MSISLKIQYTQAQFQQRFRMQRHVFLIIVETLGIHDKYFRMSVDAVGRSGLPPLQKCTVAIRILAYGSPADSVDDYVRIVLKKKTSHQPIQSKPHWFDTGFILKVNRTKLNQTAYYFILRVQINFHLKTESNYSTNTLSSSIVDALNILHRDMGQRRSIVSFTS